MISFPHLALTLTLLSGSLLVFSSPVSTITVAAAQSASISHSMSLAVLPFENLTRQPADEWMGLSLAESLTGSLAKLPSLQVIERSQLKRVLSEQNFSQSALVDSSQAPALGKLVGAKQMVVGHFQKVGEKLRIQARVLQVETGQVLPESVVQVEGSAQAYFSLLDQLSEQLNQKFQPQFQSIPAQPQATVQEAQSLYYRGLYLLENGNSAQQGEAEALFQKALSINPQDALVQAALAQHYLNKGRTGEGEPALAKATHWADNALSLNPQLRQAWQIKLEIAEYHNDPAAGERVLHAALKILPGNTELILAYINLLDNQNMFSTGMTSAEVKALYQRLGANMQDPHILLDLGTHLINESYDQRQPDYTEALAVLNRARAGLPDNPTIPLYLGNIHLALNNPELAEKEIEKALALDPQSQWTHLMAHGNLISLAYYYKHPDRKAHDKALSVFEKALTLAQELTEMAPQNVFYLIKVAEDYDKLDRTEAALQSLEQARKLNPNHPNLYTFELKLHKKAKNWDAALNAIAKGMEACLAAPQHFSGILPQLKYEKAFVLRKQGKTDEALLLYQDLRQNSEGFRNIALQDMIAIYQEKKRYTEVIELYQALFNLEPSLAEEDYYRLDYKRSWILAELLKTPRSAPLLNELAQLAIQQGDVEGAQNTFQLALASDPENAIILYNFGSFLLSQQAFADAKTALEKALKNQPKYINAAYNLGLTYLALNQKAEAKVLFEQILAWQPGHVGATEAVKNHFR